MSKFGDLGLSGPILEAIEKVGYDTPTPIQEQAIPELLRGSDVIGQAQTGTGKTAAFGLPMLQSIDPDIPEVQALVLTPTRELCIQVAQALRAYGASRGIDVLATFGGAPIRAQMDRLKAGPQVVVGTVGRVLDLHGRHALMFHDARFVVLDEADEMLDLGFLEDVEMILKKCPNGRQTALFSATMPPPIAKLAERHLHDPVTIRVKAPTLTIDTVEHYQVPASRNDKVDALVEVLSAEQPQQAIIFVRTKIGVDRLAKDLDRRKPGLRVRALHGDMSQGSRDGVMIGFKDGRVPVLVATDIAARGLDVEKVSHVINYDLPNSAEIYTHRIGRTGRAGRGGRAITLVEPKDKDDMIAIEKHINVEIPVWTTEQAGKSLEPARKRRAKGASQEIEESETSTEEPQKSEKTEKPTKRTPRSRKPKVEAAEAVETDAAEIAEIPADAEVLSAIESDPDMPLSIVPVVDADTDDDNDDETAPDEAQDAEPELRHPRHVKPTQDRLDDENFSLLIVNSGTNAGVEPADVIEMIAKAGDLHGDDIRRVRVLQRFTLAQVPSDAAERTATALDGAKLRGTAITADAVINGSGRAPASN
ncbi:MAG TPA: DEAD/DEAH box helicase [Solirubrobacterales bacterium]|jgi:ATP-dependent RNA helicase DeaD|nr:DEAD/DEAH box helicase [Solirubrobacterales bacterium]